MEDPKITVLAPTRSLAEIITDLRRTVSPEHLRERRQGGATITYLPWHHAQRLLTKATHGQWECHVTDKAIFGQCFTITVALTIHCADGSYTREGTGIEDLETKSFGDFQSNAESMAFRRACARFGLALHLYDKEL